MKIWAPSKIPEEVREALQRRLDKHRERHWRETYRRVEVTFRGRYAYVDAYPAREIGPLRRSRGKPKDEKVPVHMCRLEYTGDQQEWGFAFYKYSDARYEPSVLPTGFFTGTPEECFDCAGQVYLSV